MGLIFWCKEITWVKLACFDTSASLKPDEFIIPEHMYIAINDFTNLEAKEQNINSCICSEK